MSSNEVEAVTAAVQQYVDGCRTGNVEQLKALFHPDAQMIGQLQGNLMYGGPEPFFAAVVEQPSPAEAGNDYETVISDVSVAGPVAQATLREQGYMGLNFTNYFQLLYSEGSWRITSKSFSHE